MKNMIIKSLILIGVVLYIVSPIDLVPGVIVDDIIVALFGLIKMRSISANQSA